MTPARLGLIFLAEWTEYSSSKLVFLCSAFRFLFSLILFPCICPVPDSSAYQDLQMWQLGSADAIAEACC